MAKTFTLATLVVLVAAVAVLLVLPDRGRTAGSPPSGGPPAEVSGPERFSTDPSIRWAEVSDEYWRQTLTPEQYGVCRQGGTERAWSGEYNDSKEPGVFVCSSCGAPLYSSTTKFDSGTGWPSFWEPISDEAVEVKTDYSFGMLRTELVCKRCGAHLGHVFDDGPKPTGKRHCINSVCLLHRPSAAQPEASASSPAPG